MVGSLYAGTSGMLTYAKATEVTANNIANVNTRGYTAKSATLAETSPSGVKVASVQDTPTPPHIRAYTNTPSAQRKNNVDISSEKVNEITSLRAYQANASTVRTADEMLGTVINLKA